MKTSLSTLALILGIQILSAQTNVRAWYADGQVWVVWEAQQPYPETYAIFAKPSAFTNTATANQVGRLFKEEYGPAALREQVDSTANYRIPNGNGGIYQLASNEALFVATPHQAGALYFAVVAWGETAVTPSVNITDAAVPFQYDPLGDPVECHLQKTFLSPFDQDYACFAFYMWADGRQNQWENRPDFPVMANAAKNGMPSFFLVSAPMGLDTTGGIPLSVWLHGGGGTARQSLAGSRLDIHLNPQQGILLAHNDDLFGKLLTFFSGYDSVSKHFGWRKNYDPFTGEAPTAIDTIVNYTQRRYRWIDEWLIRRYSVDRNRININGHSMGSRGATLMGKTFPAHYASVTVLNNAFEDVDEPSLVDVVFGNAAADFPTNLTGYNGETIHWTRAMNLETRLSDQRDWPLMRCYHAKNDTGGSNEWDDYVVEEYRAADSLGWGTQLFWSERAHGPDTGPDYDDHWINGFTATQQTIVDDIAYEELHFRSDISFPAFFNHRLDPQNNDPGDGTQGTGPNGVGDDWGTWGGYHRWANDDLTDTPTNWAVTAWLESNAVFSNDNCPNDHLTADLAIRKPQQFKPGTGTGFSWVVKDFATNEVLQTGTGNVGADNLVTIPQVVVFRENTRKVRIEVSTMPLATGSMENEVFDLSIYPNPSVSGLAVLSVHAEMATSAILRVQGIAGQVFTKQVQLQPGENRLVLTDLEVVPAGFYLVELGTEGQRATVKWMKL